MPRYIDLSYPLKNGQPCYPGDPPIHIESAATIAADGCNVTRLTLGSHQGTHLDAPYHFCEDGSTLDQLSLERFHGPASLIDFAVDGPLAPETPLTREMFEPMESLFTPRARVLYHTGWSRMAGTPEFFTRVPSLTVEAAKWIAEHKIGLLGMDTPTPAATDGREVHRVLLGRPAEIILVEGLANLDQLPPHFTFIGFPLNLTGRDGSPIRAVAVVE